MGVHTLKILQRAVSTPLDWWVVVSTLELKHQTAAGQRQTGEKCIVSNCEIERVLEERAGKKQTLWCCTAACAVAFQTINRQRCGGGRIHAGNHLRFSSHSLQDVAKRVLTSKNTCPSCPTTPCLDLWRLNDLHFCIVLRWSLNFSLSIDTPPEWES